LDGAGTEDAAAQMIQRVTELALGFPEGRLEIQLVGGYSDPRNYSEELFYNILCMFNANKTKILLSLD
jgi:protein N-terminal asparagine amidohydrolase